MKRSQFSNTQKTFVIRQGEDGRPVEEVCRMAGISQATHFAWKKQGTQRAAGIVTNRVDRAPAIPPTIRIGAGKRITVVAAQRIEF